MKTRHRVIALLAFGLLVSASFILLEVPGNSRLLNAIQNSGHGLAFALLTLVSLLSLGIRNHPQAGKLLTLVSLSLFTLGISIEIAQHLTGRGASINDIGMNVLGIVAGIAFATGLRKHPTEAVRKRVRRRSFAWTTGICALLWCLRMPIAIATTDAFAPDLPLLAAFEQPLALAKFGQSEVPAELKLVSEDPRWPSNTTTSLEARFSTGQWPGFRLIEPPADWRGYHTLAIQIVNPSKNNVSLNVRVDQRAIVEDIFWSAAVVLTPGVNQFEIELATMRPDIELFDRPDHQPFRDISQLLFFLSRDQQEHVTLLFDEMSLLPH